MLAGVLSWITDLTDQLVEYSANWWFLIAIFVIAFLDSVIPVVPSETTVIVGGVAVATDVADYSLWMVIVAGAVGAFLGDNLAYSIGRFWAPAFERRAERRPKFKVKLHWARTQIDARGGMLLITARFIPGGRTVMTLSCGITRQARLWFMFWTAIAVTIWATYAAVLAYVIGEPLEDNHTAALWIAFFVAIAINLIIELIRHVRNKRRYARQQKLLAAEAD